MTLVRGRAGLGPVALASVALALAGCARPGTAPGGHPDAAGMVRTAGCATATSPPAMSIDGTPQPANQERLDGVANRLQPYAQAHFADVFTGVELRSEQDRIRVYRKPSADFDAWMVANFATDCVEIVDALHSAKELTALQDRIVADIPYWQSRGVVVNEVSANPDGSGVQVGTTDVERARSELTQRYGADAPIEVVQANPVPAFGPLIGSAGA